MGVVISPSITGSISIALGFYTNNKEFAGPPSWRYLCKRLFNSEPNLDILQLETLEPALFRDVERTDLPDASTKLLAKSLSALSLVVTGLK